MEYLYNAKTNKFLVSPIPRLARRNRRPNETRRPWRVRSCQDGTVARGNSSRRIPVTRGGSGDFARPAETNDGGTGRKITTTDPCMKTPEMIGAEDHERKQTFLGRSNSLFTEPPRQVYRPPKSFAPKVRRGGFSDGSGGFTSWSSIHDCRWSIR